jgi:translation initiation factor 2 subunit 1
MIIIMEKVYAALMVSIRRKLAKQALKLRADVEVECFSEAGIDAIKAALLAGKECGTDDAPIAIQLIAPPKVRDVIIFETLFLFPWIL